MTTRDHCRSTPKSELGRALRRSIPTDYRGCVELVFFEDDRRGGERATRTCLCDLTDPDPRPAPAPR